MTYWDSSGQGQRGWPGDPFGGAPDAPPVTYGNQPAPTFHGGQPVPTPPAGPTNPLAVLSVVFAFVAPPAGIALGHVAQWQIKKHNQPGRRLALIGTVLSYVMTVLLIVALVVWLLMSRDEPTPAVAPTGTTAPSAAPPTTTTTSTAPSGPLAWGTPEQILTEEQDDVAVGLDGSVYLADQDRGVIRYDPASGTRETLPFRSGVHSVAVDQSGNVYGCGGDVWKLTKGSSTPEKLPFTSLESCKDVSVDAAGNVYAASIFGAHQVFKLDAASGSATVLPLTGSQEPTAIEADAEGNLYVVNTPPSLIGSSTLRLDAETGEQTTVDIPKGSIKGIATDSSGNLYRAANPWQLYMRDAATGAVKLILDDPRNSASRFDCKGMATDSQGNLYCVGLNGLWKVPRK